MTTMNISLPESMKAFVDDQVADRGFGRISEYVRELIRKDQDGQNLRVLLAEGERRKGAIVADAAYFDGLRRRIRPAVNDGKTGRPQP
jgi:antitoxin ParD1/3/4